MNTYHLYTYIYVLLFVLDMNFLRCLKHTIKRNVGSIDLVFSLNFPGFLVILVIILCVVTFIYQTLHERLAN